MLDDNQLEAVNFYKGPCLTLAGPGSGKTTVLVNRIINLINHYKVNPESILVITFTKDAALQMQSRFISLCNNKRGGLVNFGTFHSIFFQILRREINIDSNSILQGKSLINFLKEVIKVSNISFDEHLIESLYQEFSYINNSKTDVNTYESEAFDNDKFVLLYNTYCNMKMELSMIDFDDMLCRTYNLFIDNPGILNKWQKRFSFYLIDEMQDMNDIQFDVVKLLTVSNNVFAVGDDDQSIYGFRGANPDIMHKFPDVYKDCKIIRLSKNYRSCKGIVDASKNLIANNELRYNKTLVANSNVLGQIMIQSFKDNINEALWVCKEADTLLKSDKKTTVAILFRNKNQSLYIMKCLTDKGISFFVKDKVANIYNHWIFRDIMSYIKISLKKGIREDFLSIYNKPNRYITRACIDKENITFDDMIMYYKDKPYMVERIKEMRSDILRISTMRPASALLYIRKKIGYDDYIKEISSGNKNRFDDCMKVLDSIMNLAKEFRDIRSFLQECNNRLEFESEPISESQSRLCLYTFHASKGLEFDNVFIVDVNEGITPSKKALDTKTLEEERRMFYVALTRAKKRLYLCHISKRNNERLFPSRFLEELEISG